MGGGTQVLESAPACQYLHWQEVEAGAQYSVAGLKLVGPVVCTRFMLLSSARVVFSERLYLHQWTVNLSSCFLVSQGPQSCLLSIFLKKISNHFDLLFFKNVLIFKIYFYDAVLWAQGLPLLSSRFPPLPHTVSPTLVQFSDSHKSNISAFLSVS